MNLIECWKKAKEGQKINRKIDNISFTEDGCLIKTKDIQDLQDHINRINYVWILSDDYEIVKEKKKVVIDMEWEQCENTNIIHPVMHMESDIDNWRDLPKNTKMKMTLEWTE